MDQLSFAALRAVNVPRCEGAFDHGLMDWTPLEWAGALCGEAGEAANITKKMRRGDYMPTVTDQALAHHSLAMELADVVTYCDLLAARCGIDLGQAVREKWNQVSEKRDWTTRL